jgi:hypothetical protein
MFLKYRSYRMFLSYRYYLMFLKCLGYPKYR